MNGREILREARLRQREDAPRRALVRDAFDATRRLPGIRDASAEEIRAALRFALAARGLHDYSDRRLDPLTRAIQTSRASVLADYALTGLHKARELIAWLEAHKTPEWLVPPRHAVPSTGEPRTLGWVDLEPRDLGLLARLLAEAPVPIHSEDEVDDLEPYFRCWLDLLVPADANSAVVVHVGTYRLGRLSEEAAGWVRPELVRLSRRRRTLLADAELHGTTPETARVHLWLAAE